MGMSIILKTSIPGHPLYNLILPPVKSTKDIFMTTLWSIIKPLPAANPKIDELPTYS